MIRGISHITLAVKDLNESFTFYEKVLEFRPLARWDKGAYLLAGNSWVCLAFDTEIRKKSLPEYTHIAFSVSKDDYQTAAGRIIRSGAIIWQENRSEGDSLYFLDPNGHKLEIHVGDWHTRLAACRKNPFNDMIFFD